MSTDEDDDIVYATGINAPLDDLDDLGGAHKNDDGKPRLDLLPPELMLAVGQVLAFGAKKYGDRNWELGMRWGRAYAAMQRHLLAWWAGEDTDDETGFSHLAHAACCVAFLLAYEQRGIGEDDRPKKWLRGEG